eukprot:TRINITY_DN67205_c0_g1_i1.p1 TRINITY_DN67205_c0_g1~~TRINITY_DN67205_c0_g1_i1.p1  ORF type:complete len:241 (-),score=39.24 TRINITY_DN67205_c0_g1_i1:498-1220(-)
MPRNKSGDVDVADDASTKLALAQHTLEAVLRENTLLRTRVAELESLIDGGRQSMPAPALEEAPLVVNTTEPTAKDRKRLLRHLQNEAYVMLAPSTIAGVGVLAIRDIPENVDPFPVCNNHFASAESFVVLSSKDLCGLPASVIEQVKSFFAPLTEDDNWEAQRDSDGNLLYGVLATGMSMLNISWYLNHSEDPNVSFKEAKDEGSYNSFVTMRAICEGEELSVNYRELGKEFFALVQPGY